ncbi:MAG: type ISP restriction/modification enzyme [Verrucomicrobiota bacterium]
MTLPANLPPKFRTAARDFADTLRASFASGMPAQPEDQLKGPVQALLATVTRGVLTKTEAQVHDLGGRPDIGVEVNQALCGFVELKAPGHGAGTRKFKDRDKRQWEKFSALPNILYTDACEWALYRTGAQTEQDNKPILIRLDGILEKGAAALDDTTLAGLHTLLLDFLSWQPIVPHEPRKLAETLAPLCRLLRADVFAAVEREGSALAHLCAEIRQYLFPHTDHKEFADIYAQTLTYALLLARLENADGKGDLHAEEAANRLDSGHGLLAQTLRILTQPEARAEIGTAVSVLARVIAAVEPRKLAKHGDPWIYFYEHFLAAYDNKLRLSYGVVYTPQEVIGCQVALVSELLADRFGKPLTFADEGVVSLDSSTGTAAYPIAAIVSALRRVEARFGKGAVAEHATRCAQNMYAFEILVGAYAVAHLRLTKLLTDAGATLPADGLHVFLTDTLESPYADPPQPPLFGKKLTDEQRRASQVKAEVPVFVCMGNPPYFREESGDDGGEKTRGKWVRFGDENKPGEHPILQDFLVESVGGHAKNLYNLYVYFWRWTLWKMFENGYAARRGIVSFITASSYLRGPGFAGMRQRMREAFDELWILDLEGDNLGARKTENVFAIQTPVCIATGIRHAVKKKHALAKVCYARITGTREEKLAKLKAIRGFGDVAWEDCFDGATEPMWPQRVGNYFAWPLLTDLWPWQGCGVKFERNWPIGETRELLEMRWHALLAASPEEKPTLFREDDDRKVSRQYTSLRPPRERLPEIAKLPPNTPPLEIARYGFRSLDRQYALADNRIGGRMNPALWLAHSDKQTYITSLLTGILGVGPATVAASNIPDLHHFRGSFGGRDVIPLWRDAAGTQPNLPAGLLNVLTTALGAPVSAEDFFAYTYAVLSAPGYVETFSEELTVPGPRLPVTRDAALFRRAVEQGRRLLWLHTYGERFLPAGAKRGQIPSGTAKCIKGIPTKPEAYPEEYSWTEGATRAEGVLRVGAGEFAPVSRAVWEFSVSGYEVLRGWLGFRMKQRSGRKSSPLDDLRPAAWTAALTAELLELLWVLEATVATQPQLNALLSEILAAPLFTAADFPAPTAPERAAPGEAPEQAQPQLEL